jgi:hypothetical protein
MCPTLFSYADWPREWRAGKVDAVAVAQLYARGSQWIPSSGLSHLTRKTTPKASPTTSRYGTMADDRVRVHRNLSFERWRSHVRESRSRGSVRGAPRCAPSQAGEFQPVQIRSGRGSARLVASCGAEGEDRGAAYKAGRPAAEPVEPRPGTEGNAGQQSTHRAPDRARATKRWNAYGKPQS